MQTGTAKRLIAIAYHRVICYLLGEKNILFLRIKRMPNIIEITDFQIPELDIYARLNEAQLLHLYEPENGIFIAESPKVIERALDAGYEPVSALVEQRHIDGQARGILSRLHTVPVYTAAYDVLTQLISAHPGYVMRHAAPSFTECTGNMYCVRQNCGPGKCCQSYKYRCYLPQCRCIGHGCRAAHSRLQRSVIPAGHQSQYGNRLSDTMDFSQ